MQLVILNDAEEVARFGANIFINHIKQKPETVLGLASGSTPVELYNKLIAANQSREISFRTVSTFNLDEYLGLPANHPQSYRHFMKEVLFKHIDIDSTHTASPPGVTDCPTDACFQYELAIAKKGGIDLQLLGIGRNGHIGFNEPSSDISSRTRIASLSKETIADNARFFDDGEFQPHLSITMGIGTILEARKIVLLATGRQKAYAIRATVEDHLALTARPPPCNYTTTLAWW